MDISTLARHGEDKITRQAYRRRQDEIYFYNKEKSEHESRLEHEQRRAEITEGALAERDALIAELRAQIGKK